MGLGLGTNVYTNSYVITEAAAYVNTHSLFMDGTNDYAEIGGTSDTFFGTGDFTISFWVKFGNHSAGNHYLFNRGRMFSTGTWDANDHMQIIYNASLDKMQFSATIGGSANFRTFGTTLSVTDDTWFHFAITNDKDGGADNLKLYKNGSFVDDQTAVNGNVGVAGSQFGLNSYANGNRRNLEYDEIAIHHTVLDANNIAAIYNSGSPIDLSADSGNYNTSSSLAHWWKLNNNGDNSAGTGALVAQNGALFTDDVPTS